MDRAGVFGLAAGGGDGGAGGDSFAVRWVFERPLRMSPGGAAGSCGDVTAGLDGAAEAVAGEGAAGVGDDVADGWIGSGGAGGADG